MPRHGYGAPVGRRVDVEQLVGLREVAECLGLPRVQTLHYMRRTDSSFPDPIWTRPTQGGHGAVWYWPEIRRWATAAGHELPQRAKSASGRRLVDVDHLVANIDIACYLGYSQAQRVYKLRWNYPDFPAPVFASSDGPWAKRLWAWPEVWRWAKNCGHTFPADLGRSPAAALRSRAQQ